MKKLLLSLGSVAAVAAPIAAVVACGNNDSVDTHGISVSAATANDVKLSFGGQDYFVKQGAKSVKVIKTPATGSGSTAKATVYATITEKDGNAITANTKVAVLKMDNAAASNVKVAAATANDFGLTDVNGLNHYVATADLKTKLIEVFNETEKVTASSDANKASETTVKELNKILESIGLVVNGDVTLKAASGNKPREIDTFNTSVKANLDAVNEIAKQLEDVNVVITVQNGKTNLAAVVAAKAVTNAADIKTAIANDVNVTADTNVEVKNFPGDLKTTTVKFAIAKTGNTANDTKIDFTVTKGSETKTVQIDFTYKVAAK